MQQIPEVIGMRYGYYINGLKDFNANIDLACEAEEAGWDGFFLPDGPRLKCRNMERCRCLTLG